MSSREQRLAAEARKDMHAILRYTKQEWGTQQQAIYANQLDEAMNRLCFFPEMGQSREEIRDGLWALAVEEHIVYYRSA
ncbi:MAG: type II toxin-antitoxin system RelE/ParE family toxin [Thermomicrobiales bacterium]